MTTLIQSSSIIDLLRTDLSGDWDVRYTDLSMDTPYEIDCDTKTITIHNFGLHIEKAMESHYFAPQIELITIEALRMARHTTHLDDIIQDLKPESIITLGRVIEADVQTIKIMAAWMARMKNQPVLWRHILCGETADMASAFIKGLETFLSSGIDNHVAMQKSMAMAFNQWFSCSIRQQKCDHDTLNMVDDHMDDVYFGQMTLSIYSLSELTSLWDESVSYLEADHRQDIITNPHYGAVRDDINQIHLNHILRDINKTYIGDLAFHDDGLAYRFATIH